MKLLVVLSILVAAAMCGVVPNRKSLLQLPALIHEEIHDEHGQYALRYVTADNTIVSQRGKLVAGKNGAPVLVVEGQYQYVGDDGQLYVSKYIADLDGFHVKNEHTPLSELNTNIPPYESYKASV